MATLISRTSFAIFLAVSWTWCIGMYLPVLLVRDMGFWGWVVFAVPNIVGAGAMGWVLCSARVSADLTRRHREACVWFSIITVAFHVFFIGWIIRELIGPAGVALAAFALAATWAISLLRRDGGRWCAVAIFALSLILAGVLLVGGHLTLPAFSLKAAATGELAALSPVCIFGFILCPYLDLTFHRVRQETSPGDGRWAFGLGFGLFFLLMILFTLGYARPLAAGAAGILALCVGIHMAVQSGFTIAAHLREVMRADLRQVHHTAALGVAVLAAASLSALAHAGSGWFGLSRPEIIYRIFMGFYALIFPAYVWICMRVPSDSATSLSSDADHQRHMMYLFAVLLACPMFAMGFLGGRWLWLWPGVAVLVVARYVNVRRPAAAPPLQSRSLSQK